MKPIFSFKPKQFLTGKSAGRYLSNGLFDVIEGIDILKDKDSYGLLRQGYGITDKSSTVVTDQILWLVKRSTYYYGFGDEGYLYQIDGSYDPTVIDSGNESGRSGCKGMVVYHDGSSEKLHFFHTTTIGTHIFGGATNNSVYSGLTNAPHPAKVFNSVLYYCNGRYIGHLSGTTNTVDKLDLGAGWIARDIEIQDNYLVILMVRGSGADDDGEDESKIIKWNGYSSNWQYEYSITERCTALEKYKNDIAIFGKNVRLLNFGAFDVIAELTDTVLPGQTWYKNNTVYWKDDEKMFSYGSPSAFISPAVHSPLKSTGDGGAIIPIDSETNKFLITNDSDKLYLYNTGKSGGLVRTFRIPVDHYLITEIGLSFEKLTSNDGVELTINDDIREIKSAKAITYSGDGAIAYKKITLRKPPSTFLRISLDWNSYTSGDMIIKQIDIYGQQSGRKN